MPRHSTKHDPAVGSQAYSQYPSSSQYLADPASTPPTATSAALGQPAQQNTQPGPKKKHVCSTCDRGFTTSGHLARHLRVHTGERNHKCPFPGCETRCSRQDNLQQHYRIHLSPGSRRSSSSATRAAIARAVGANGSKNSRSSSAIVTPERLSSDSPSPPALEHAMIPPPPDSPPPLVQAYPVAHVPAYNNSIHSTGSSSRSPTPLENTYPMIPPHSQGLTNGHIASLPSPLASHYSDSPPTYTESSHHSSYGYVSPSSHAPATNAVDQSYDYSYSEKSPLPRLQPTLHHASMDSIHDHSPPSSATLSSVSSRLSISHISHPHPQSYPSHYHAVSSPSPDSGHSVSPHSQASGPPTPNYTAYHDDRHDGATYHTIDSVPDHSGLANGYVSSHSHIVHGGYNHSMLPQQSLPRYDSPPPILAPIQDERVIRGDIRIPHVQHSPVSSIPATPLSNSYMHSSIHSYPYHAPHLSLNQTTWKHDALLRGRS